MHPDTRNAILAMITGIEQQCALVRGMLSGVTAADDGRPLVPLTSNKQQSRAYLSEDEDEELAKELGLDMEPEEQQNAVQEMMQRALTGMAPHTTEQRNAAFLRGAMGGE
jgi:hypothetical protein